MSRFIELHLNEKDSPLVIVTQIELFTTDQGFSDLRAD